MQEDLVMIFDTETNGLSPKTSRILSLAYIIYDKKRGEILKEYNRYVQIDVSVIISAEITKINQITKEICASEGIDIKEILHSFCSDYKRVNTLVAHNINFDKNMILAEIERNAMEDVQPIIFNNVYNRENNIIEICTMVSGRSEMPLGKNPRLGELYTLLTELVPENWHNALADTRMCLRCYQEMNNLKGITTTDFKKRSLNNSIDDRNEVNLIQDGHIYHRKGNKTEIFESVTELIRRIESPTSQKLRTPTLYMTEGTVIHEEIANYLTNGIFPKRTTSQFDCFLVQHNAFLSQGKILIKHEWLVYDEVLHLAGTIDAVYRNVDNTISVYDWKLSINSTPYKKYKLQLLLYKYILEHNYCLNVENMSIVFLSRESAAIVVEVKNEDLLFKSFLNKLM